MSRRYGRNQKRAHRERIAELEAEVVLQRAIAASNQRHAGNLLFKLQSARAEALTELLEREDIIKIAMTEIGAQMGAMMGKQYMPHVRKLIEASRSRDRPAFIARGRDMPPDAFGQPTPLAIEGIIPSLHYCIRVLP